MNTVDYIDVFMRKPDAGTDASGDALQLPHWTVDEWKRVLARTRAQPFKKGELLIKQGALDRSLYFVATGTLSVDVTGGAGNEHLAQIGPGSVVGEQAFFDGQPRSANVTALTDGTLLCLGFREFEIFGKEDQTLSRDLLSALARVLSTRLRSATSRFRR